MNMQTKQNAANFEHFFQSEIQMSYGSVARFAGNPAAPEEEAVGSRCGEQKLDKKLIRVIRATPHKILVEKALLSSQCRVTVRSIERIESGAQPKRRST